MAPRKPKILKGPPCLHERSTVTIGTPLAPRAAYSRIKLAGIVDSSSADPRAPTVDETSLLMDWLKASAETRKMAGDQQRRLQRQNRLRVRAIPGGNGGKPCDRRDAVGRKSLNPARFCDEWPVKSSLQ